MPIPDTAAIDFSNASHLKSISSDNGEFCQVAESTLVFLLAGYQEVR